MNVQSQRTLPIIQSDLWPLLGVCQKSVVVWTQRGYLRARRVGNKLIYDLREVREDCRNNLLKVNHQALDAAIQSAEQNAA